MKKNRFRVVLHEQEDDNAGSKVIEDTKTGITYLFHYMDGCGGLTVLRDEEGEPDVVPEQ